MILFTVDKVFTRYLLIKRRRLDEVEYPILNKTTTLVHVIFLNVNYLPLEKGGYLYLNKFESPSPKGIAEILPIRRKTLSNQSINQSITQR